MNKTQSLMSYLVGEICCTEITSRKHQATLRRETILNEENMEGIGFEVPVI